LSKTLKNLTGLGEGSKKDPVGYSGGEIGGGDMFQEETGRTKLSPEVGPQKQFPVGVIPKQAGEETYQKEGLIDRKTRKTIKKQTKKTEDARRTFKPVLQE